MYSSGRACRLFAVVTTIGNALHTVHALKCNCMVVVERGCGLNLNMVCWLNTVVQEPVN